MMTTLVKKSIYTRCKEMAEAANMAFEQITLGEMGGRIVYVVDGHQMTPEQAEDFLTSLPTKWTPESARKRVGGTFGS